MINVTAKPLRTIALGNFEKIESGIDCMFCRSVAIGLLGSRMVYAIKESYTLVYGKLNNSDSCYTLLQDILDLYLVCQ